MKKVIALLLLCMSLCMADTVVATTTLNVGDIKAGGGWTGGVQEAPPFTPFSVALNVGDTFDYTINFLPGQQLTITNLSFIWAYSYANAVADVEGTGQLSLLGADGKALYTSDTKTDTEGHAHFGQQFNGSDFSGLPTTVTFAGLHYVGTVINYETVILDDGTTSDPVTVRTYNEPALYFTADSFTTNAVPESSSPLEQATSLFSCFALLLIWRRSKTRA